MEPVARPRNLVAIANAVLSGWNVGLVSAFLTAIALAALLGGGAGLSDGTPIAVVVGVAVLVGGALGYVIARSVAAWFARRQPWIGRVWLVGLFAVTLLSFPGFFRFSV